MRDEGEQSNTTICEACGTAVPSYDVVSYGSIDRGYRELCTRCFNAEVASVLGLERFEHVQLQPIVMMDCAGEKHEFHFGIRLLGHVMALEPSSSRPVCRAATSSRCWGNRTANHCRCLAV